VADAIVDRSGGNAYLVEELTGTLRGGGDLLGLSPSLKDVLLSRVDALSPTRSGCCGPRRWPGGPSLIGRRRRGRSSGRSRSPKPGLSPAENALADQRRHS
jgi:hypothetical protein